MSKEVEIPNLSHLIERYLSGVSMKHISDESGIGRGVLTRRFRLQGVEIRGRSDAEFLKWKSIRKDPAAVRRQLSAAWQAGRGRIVSLETKTAQAKTRYERLLSTSPKEFALAAAMSKRGFSGLAHQYALGPYNLDLAVSALRVAVEVENGTCMSRWTSMKRKRVEYLLNRKWALVIISRRAVDPSNGWARTRERTPHGTFAPEGGKSPRPDFEFSTIADKLIAFLDGLGGLPSSSGQYGVVGREAQPVPVARAYLKRWPRIEGF